MPVTGKENIFDALFKWGDVKSKEEDFYSKSLILVLRRLKDDNQELATNFLNSLLDCELFRPGTAWEVTGQVGEENRPDIRLKSDDVLAYVEVKWRGSKTSEEQVQKYLKELEEEKKCRAFLFLLTPLGLDNNWGNPDRRQVSWVKTCLCLRKIKEEWEQGLADKNLAPEAYYLVWNFYEFLKEKGMGVEKVSKMVDSESLLELKKYLFLIKAGCLEAKFSVGEPKLEFSDDEDWVGWWFKDKETQKRNPEDYWCGFYQHHPTRVGFGVTNEVYKSLKKRMRRKPDLEQMLKDEFRWEDYGDNEDEWSGEFFFDLPVDFLDLKVEKQVERIADFISRVLETAFRRKIKAT